MPTALSRRRFLALTGAGITAPALSACGVLGAGSTADGLSVHSQLGGNAPGAPAWNEAVKLFRQRNPDLPLTALENGDDLQQVYETSKLAGKEADVVITNLYDKSLAWTDLGATVPVGEYMDRWGLRDRVNPSSLAEWTDQKGRLCGFPYVRTNWPVVFNEALLRRAGVDEVPTTVDALIAAAGKLRSRGIGAVTVGGNDWSGQKLFLQIVQTYLKPDEAKEVLASGDFSGSAGARQGIEHFVELRKAGVFVENVRGLSADLMTTQIGTEKAAVASMLSSVLGEVPDEAAGHIRVGGWPVPEDSVHPKPTVMRVNGAHGIWVSPNGRKKPDRVERFVRFMYSPEVVSTFVGHGRDLALSTSTTSARFPLVAAAQRLTDNDVSEIVCPDTYVPSAANLAVIQATGAAFDRDSGARQVRTALEKAYRGVRA
ncbi:ABC transporter substrate-binding protein [Streptomyces sp. 8N114]|uniref:ABC transporter substrate-binding protein n=1 Tax=Streptomyces sp. 8N114 TaxID=3457419 RepID=UPI003FD0111F